VIIGLNGLPESVQNSTNSIRFNDLPMIGLSRSLMLQLLGAEIIAPRRWKAIKSQLAWHAKFVAEGGAAGRSLFRLDRKSFARKVNIRNRKYMMGKP
jgi:hypothetical protein